jgi:hypothetical protein
LNNIIPFHKIKNRGGKLLNTSKAVVWLSAAIIVLVIIATSLGLFWQTANVPSSFISLRGQTVDIYGQGLYRYDTVFSAAGYKGTDLVVLCLSIPFLIVLTFLYKRGSLRAGLLLTGLLTYILYVYASLALGAAFNELFLVYTAIFGASFFALILIIKSVNWSVLQLQTIKSLPRRFPAILLFVCGLVTIFVWITPIITSLVSSKPPDRLDSYTTLMTFALDLAIITPSTFIAGSLIFKRTPFGYIMAFALFGVIIMLAPGIIASTISQIRSGISFTPGEVIGPTAGFVILGLLAIWVIVTILRCLPINGSTSISNQTPGTKV